MIRIEIEADDDGGDGDTKKMPSKHGSDKEEQQQEIVRL